MLAELGQESYRPPKTRGRKEHKRERRQTSGAIRSGSWVGSRVMEDILTRGHKKGFQGGYKDYSGDRSKTKEHNQSRQEGQEVRKSSLGRQDKKEVLGQDKTRRAVS